jgi:hypothetical protein
MLWLVALFIILQPGIFSKKKTFVKVEDVLLRALIFGIVMYFLGGSKEAFQDSNPTCNSPDGYIRISIPGGSDNIVCLKQSVDISVKPTTGYGNTITTGLYYNNSQRITIQDGTAYYTAPLMTKAQWNPDAGPIEQVFPYPTHNAIFMGVSNKLDFISHKLYNIPQDKWEAVSSFMNSFIYEIPPTGASFTLIPSSAAAAPPLPIEPISADWLSSIRTALIQSETAAAGGPPPGYIGYTGPPPPSPGDNGPQLPRPGELQLTPPPPPPPGYIQAAFLRQNDINAGFDNIDTYLSQLSYGIKNIFNRSSGPPPTGPSPP